MMHHSIREWEHLSVDNPADQNSITRASADRLLSIARTTSLGGDEGERILLNGVKKLRAQQVVGVLTAEGVSLEILPKIDGASDDGATRRSLIHMLAAVLDLEVASGAVTDLDWQKDNLLEILIRLFCTKLFEAVHRGLPRRYVGHQEDLGTLKGRLDVRRQFTTLASSPQKLACQYDELSSDIPLNQLMKAVVLRLAKLSRAPENQRMLRELSFVFAEVGKVPRAVLSPQNILIDRTNSSWKELLKLAQMLLGERYQTTTSGGGRGFSLLFEMNTLFEEFVGRSLRRALVGTDLHVHLQGPMDHALVDHLSGKARFATRPDIVISRNGSPVMVIDTKWKRLKGEIDDPKRGVGQADIYQMMAYAHVYRCEQLMLLYPHHRGSGVTDGVIQVHRITNKPTSRVSIATLLLSNPKSVVPRLREMCLNTIHLSRDETQ